MLKFWYIINNVFFLPLFIASVNIARLFNKKINKAIVERKYLFGDLSKNILILDKNRKNILVQCSSVGEFEQAKPIIEELDKYNCFNFIISFFSPSGYHYSKIDFKLSSPLIRTYLPFEIPKMINHFLDIINPYCVIFIRYDLWFNFLYYLKKRKVYKLIVNASHTNKFKKNILLVRSFYKTMYNLFDRVVTIDKQNYSVLSKLIKDKSKLIKLSDTKLERISKVVENLDNDNLLDKNIFDKKVVFIAGSTWEDDNNIILPSISKLISFTNGSQSNELLTIIVPHEPNEKNINEIESCIKANYNNLKSIRYSKINNYEHENIIIIDNVGLLLKLYKYANLAYVGGGFYKGLHNVMEPARYGIPVLFGDEKLSYDAELLIKNGGGIPIHDVKTFYKNLSLLVKKKEWVSELGKKAESVFENEGSASKEIAKIIFDA